MKLQRLAKNEELKRVRDSVKLCCDLKTVFFVRQNSFVCVKRCVTVTGRQQLKVVSRSHKSKVKATVNSIMDRYKIREDDDEDNTSFSWPTKPANARYVCATTGKKIRYFILFTTAQLPLYFNLI